MSRDLQPFITTLPSIPIMFPSSVNAFTMEFRRSKHYQMWKNTIAQPFADDAFMTDTADYSWAHLQRPQLRQFRMEGEVKFLRRLGAGLDGIVWKVEISGRKYALKLVCATTREARQANIQLTA